MRKEWYQLQKQKQKQNPAEETKRSKATSENEAKKKRKERDPSQTQSRCHHTQEKSIADSSLSQLSASHTQTGNDHTSAATVATRDPPLAQIHGQMMMTKSMKEYLSRELIEIASLALIKSKRLITCLQSPRFLNQYHTRTLCSLPDPAITNELDNQVLVESKAWSRTVILNKPSVLNCLSTTMRERKLWDVEERWKSDV
ncbi:hypothetical protein CFP56_043937 [Quercus suber]|uniref:Uncharacterized protein n=1 Tax=Quercus suber TaxID=58331 RepID=A0AAW0IQ11_QUESU